MRAALYRSDQKARAVEAFRRGARGADAWENPQAARGFRAPIPPIQGFAAARRSTVRHGHFAVNGRKAMTPSILVRSGWKVTLREKSRTVVRITAALETVEGRSLPQWLEIDKDNFEGTIVQLPVREDITLPIDEQLIVEFYSR